MKKVDFIVVGAGIAGASVAAHLAEKASVLLIDMEERAGFHSTARSAASYEPNYGPPPVLAFTRASLDFFATPPAGFREGALFIPRPSLFLEAENQAHHTSQLLNNASALQEISPSETYSMFPVLKPGYAKRSFLDQQTGDLDVDLIHRGYLRLLKERGGLLLLSAPLQEASRHQGQWHVRCGSETFSAGTIVNAAGAWGDVVATRCGARPIGLTPKRRSIGVIPQPDMAGVAAWPMVTDVGETWYVKPQSGSLIVSSADATPVEPHDAYADDMAIAEGIDRLMTATTIEVERLSHSWGGLRSFAPDGNLVVGFDPHADGFFWLIGQGGYGIQTCPALSQTAASLATGGQVPEVVQAQGLNLTSISPQRFYHD